MFRYPRSGCFFFEETGYMASLNNSQKTIFIQFCGVQSLNEKARELSKITVSLKGEVESALWSVKH